MNAPEPDTPERNTTESEVPESETSGQEPSPAPIPHVPEHTRLYHVLHHPLFYLLLLGLWLGFQDAEWLPRQRLPKRIESAEPKQTDREQAAYGLGGLIRQLVPRRRAGGDGRVSPLLLALSGGPLLIGLALFFVYIFLRAHHVQILPHGGIRGAPWSAWHLARIGVVFVLVARLVSAAVGWVQGAPGEGEAAGGALDYVLAVVGTNATFLVTCAFAFLLVAAGGGDPLKALGLRERRVLHRAGLGVLGFLTALPLIALAALIMRLIWLHLGREIQLQSVLEAARHMSLAGFLTLGAAAVIVAPITEEILFRGFLYGTLRRYAGPLVAILGSALIFASLHETQTFLPILVIGALLAFLYERTGSLIAPIAAHAVNNLYTFLLLYAHYR
jgi:membrane protease YdiL (CAAX protease family)